ncbi:MAG: class I SAM-dependent methyltransferase [Gemmatimonadales bacterium]
MLPPRPTWLPDAGSLRDFYGRTTAYPYYRLQVTDYIARLVAPDGNTDRLDVIDVGSGDGYLGAVLQTWRPSTRVIGVETQVRALTRSGFEPVLFDGLHLPFPDRSFDVAILSNVLHHADDQPALFAETCRVTRRRVVIKDHLAASRLDRWKLALLDVLGNRRFGADTRGDYLGRDEWSAMFARVPRANATWYEGLSFRTGPLALVFGNGLEVVFAVDLQSSTSR